MCLDCGQFLVYLLIDQSGQTPTLAPSDRGVCRRFLANESNNEYIWMMIVWSQAAFPNDPNLPKSTTRWSSWPPGFPTNRGWLPRAIRLACIDDAIAEPSSKTLRVLKAKHHPPPSDSNVSALDNTSPLAFTIDTDFIMRVISSFPKGLGGGCDGLLPQHLKDLTGPSAALLTALVGLNLIALTKKSDDF